MTVYNGSQLFLLPLFRMRRRSSGKPPERYGVAPHHQREIREAVEQGFFEHLRGMADEYERLKRQIAIEAQRFRTLSVEAGLPTKEGELFRKGGEQAIESLRQALRDLPRAVMQYVTQNPEIYTQIQRMGGFQAWAKRFDQSDPPGAPLPTLLQLLENGLAQLREDSQE